MTGSGTVDRRNLEFFRDCASGYDKGREHFYLNDSRRIDRDLYSLFRTNDLSEIRTIDIGCGTGFYSSIVAARGGRSFCCVDLNDTFLDQTRAKISSVNPRADVTCYRSDFKSFVDQYGNAEKSADLIILGSVLQYVPGHTELLRRLAISHPRASFYVAAHLLPEGTHASLFGTILRAGDYKLHCMFHGEERAKKPSVDQVPIQVEHTDLESMFRELDFETSLYRYTTFHTALFNHTFRMVGRVIPGLGAFFTLIARRQGQNEYA